MRKFEVCVLCVTFVYVCTSDGGTVKTAIECAEIKYLQVLVVAARHRYATKVIQATEKPQRLLLRCEEEGVLRPPVQTKNANYCVIFISTNQILIIVSA